MFQHQYPGMKLKHEAPTFYIQGLAALTDADWWLRCSDRAALHHVAACMRDSRRQTAYREPGWSFIGRRSVYDPSGSLRLSGLVTIECIDDPKQLLHWNVRLFIDDREVWLSRAARLRLRRMIGAFRGSMEAPTTP